MNSLAETLSTLDHDTVRVTVEAGIATLTITRPKALNALSPEVIQELGDTLETLHAGLTGENPDWSVRGVIVTGDGEKSFVAGADIAEMHTMTPAEAKAYALKAHRVTTLLETLPVPTVAAVNGFALGGGCELAMACDVIYASSNASFGQPEVGLGLIPGFGGCVRLQRYVGSAMARELIFTGRCITAEEAERLGLVQRVCEDVAALRQAAHDTLSLAARQSPVAVANAKQTLRAVEACDIDSGLEAEAERFAECFDTADMREGTAAFLEKRRPEFPA